MKNLSWKGKKKKKLLFLNSNRIKTDNRKNKISPELSKKTDIKLNRKYFTLIFYLSETFSPWITIPHFFEDYSQFVIGFYRTRTMRAHPHIPRDSTSLTSLQVSPQSVIRLTRRKKEIVQERHRFR